MKRLMCLFICFAFLIPQAVYAEGDEAIDGVEAKSCILIEQSTGEVLLLQLHTTPGVAL